MKPRMTGVGIKLATHPMRMTPKEKKKMPIRTARVEVSVLNSAVPWVATAPTVTAEIRLGWRLIKSTIQGRLQDRERRDSFAPAGHSALQSGGSPSTC